MHFKEKRGEKKKEEIVQYWVTSTGLVVFPRLKRGGKTGETVLCTI